MQQTASTAHLQHGVGVEFEIHQTAAAAVAAAPGAAVQLPQNATVEVHLQQTAAVAAVVQSHQPALSGVWAEPAAAPTVAHLQTTAPAHTYQQTLAVQQHSTTASLEQPQQAAAEQRYHGNATSSVQSINLVDGRSVAEDCARKARALKCAKRQQTQSSYGYELRKWRWCLQHYIDDDDGHEAGGVREQPLQDDLTTREGMLRACRYIDWIGRNYPGLETKNKAEQLGEATLDKVHAALQEHYQSQVLAHLEGKYPMGMTHELTSFSLYRTSFKLIKDSFHRKPGTEARPANIDPQAKCAAESITKEELELIARQVLEDNKATADKLQCLRCWCSSTGSRNDDARKQVLHDWEDPRPFPVLGPKANVLSAVHRGGKTQKLHASHIGCIRDVKPLCCAHFWMAVHYLRRFVLEQVPYPDPNNKKSWTNHPQWASSAILVCIAYEACRRADNAVQRRAGISTSKSCHAWRVYSARQVDDAGLPDQVVSRWCKWSPEVMYDAYLRSYSRSALLAAAGWDPAEEFMFFSERFYIEVPESLVAAVSPYLGHLREQAKHLSRDTPRPSVNAAVKLIHYLTVVLIQDAAAGLAEEFPDHDVMSYLMGFQEFRDLVTQHKANCAQGAFDHLRPRRQHERLQSIESLLQQRYTSGQSQEVFQVACAAASSIAPSATDTQQIGPAAPSSVMQTPPRHAASARPALQSGPAPALARSPYGPLSPASAREAGRQIMHYKRRAERSEQREHLLQQQLLQQASLLQRFMGSGDGPPPPKRACVNGSQVTAQLTPIHPPAKGSLAAAAEMAQSTQTEPRAAIVSGPMADGKPLPGVRAIPMLSVLGSWVGLFEKMYVGASDAPPLLDLEAQYGHKWRPGAKSRWREVRVGWQEILQTAGETDDLLRSPTSQRRRYLQAAQQLDETRAVLGPGGSAMGFPTHLKKVIMPRHKKFAPENE